MTTKAQSAKTGANAQAVSLGVFRSKSLDENFGQNTVVVQAVQEDAAKAALEARIAELEAQLAGTLTGEAEAEPKATKTK